MAGEPAAMQGVLPDHAVGLLDVASQHHRAMPEPGVVIVVIPRLGQVSDPLPRILLLGRCDDEHAHIFRPMPDGGLTQQRAGQALRLIGVAEYLDPLVLAQIDGARHARDVLMRHHEPVRRRCADRVELGQRRQFRGLQREAQRLLLGADADGEKVLVRGDALPAAHALLRDGDQGIGGRIVPQFRTALFPGGRAHGLAQIGEVCKILAPGGRQIGLALGALPDSVDQHESHGGQHEHASGEESGDA